MASTYDLVCYEPGLKNQVIELQTQLWSPSPELNAAYFEWKYERNPYVDTPLIYLALHDQVIVGMRGFFGTEWEGGVPAARAIALYADDLIVAPQHRNRGVVPKIMSMAFEDLARRQYDLAVNLSAVPMTTLLSLAAGWRSVGSVEPMRERGLQSALIRGRNQIVKRLPGSQWARTGLRDLANGESLATIRWRTIECALATTPWIRFEERPRCAAMAELVERIGSDGRIRHVRDTTYFNWRFQNPLSRYRFLFWEKPRLEGYLVLQESTTPYIDREVVNIVDWEATSIDVQSELLRAALELTAGRSHLVWSASLSPQAIAVLQRCGFAPLQSPSSATRAHRAILVRNIRGEKLSSASLFAGTPVLDIKNWDVRMLYSMHG